MTKCGDDDQFVLVSARVHRDLVTVIARLAEKSNRKFSEVAGELMQEGVESERRGRGKQKS